MPCSSGLIRYPSIELAERSMYYIRSRAKKNQVVPERAFYCHKCGGYHLTSEEKDYITGDFDGKKKI